MLNFVLSKPVKNISTKEWSLILGGAGNALKTSNGLKESILKRQSLQIFFHNFKPAGIITTDYFPCIYKGVKTVCVFSGNTFIKPEYRGMNLIQLYVLINYIKVKLRWPNRKIFWYYGSNGYKSYLILANNFKVYYPNLSRQIPEWEAGYLKMLTEHFYGHSGKGPIPADHNRSFNQQDTKLDPASLSPKLALYTEKNPNFVKGEKLPCLGPWTLLNLTYFILINPLKKVFGLKKRLKQGEL